MQGAVAHERKLDLPGAVLISAGLTAVVYGIVRTDTLGWGSLGVLVPLALGIVLLGLFALVEGKLAVDPLIPLGVFRMPALRAANLIVALLYAATFAMWYFISLFLQEVRAEDALVAGISFLPLTLSFFAGSATAPKLVARLGVRATMTLGMGVATFGFLLLGTVQTGSAYEVAILPGGVLATLGAGWSMVPATIVAVKGVPAEQNGLASGCRQHLAPGRRHARPGGADDARHLAHQRPARRRDGAARRADQRLPARLLHQRGALPAGRGRRGRLAARPPRGRSPGGLSLGRSPARLSLGCAGPDVSSQLSALSADNCELTRGV